MQQIIIQDVHQAFITYFWTTGNINAKIIINFQHRTVNYKEPTACSSYSRRIRRPFGTDCGSSTGRGAVKMQNSTTAIALRSGHQDILLNTRRKSLLTKGIHPLTRYTRNSSMSWMEHLNDILDDNINRRPLFDWTLQRICMMVILQWPIMFNVEFRMEIM